VWSNTTFKACSYDSDAKALKKAKHHVKSSESFDVDEDPFEILGSEPPFDSSDN